MAGQGAGDQLQLRVPRLPGVDQVTARLHGGGQARQGITDHLVVGEQLVQAGDHRQRRFGRQGREVVAVEGIGFDEAGNLAQAFLGDQRAAVAHVDVAVVAQQDRLRQRADPLQGFENVAPVAGGDVDDAHFALLGAQFFHGQAQQFFHVQLALANAAPADGIQVVAVDQPAQGRGAGRLVAVHVVQGAAGVETAVETQLDPGRELAAQAHAGAGHAPVQVTQGVVRQGRRQRLGLGAGQAQAVGVEQGRAVQRSREVLQDEAPGAGDGRGPGLLAEGVVEEARQDVFFLVQAAQALEELLLGPAMDDEVGAGNQQLGRHLDSLGIGHHPFGGFVQAQQHVHRDRLGDQRVAVIGGHARRVVAEEARLDVAVDEKVAAKTPHQRQARAGERHVELDLERRRRQHQGADARRVIVDPGGGNHRADALGHHGHVFFVDAVAGPQVIAEGLHVAHAGGEARAVATGAGRLAVAAGIPGEEIEGRQVQFVHQVGDARGVFMAAVEQQHGLARGVRRGGGGRPVAVEQLDAVVGGEGLVESFAHGNFLIPRGRFAGLLVVGCLAVVRRAGPGEPG